MAQPQKRERKDNWGTIITAIVSRYSHTGSHMRLCGGANIFDCSWHIGWLLILHFIFPSLRHSIWFTFLLTNVRRELQHWLLLAELAIWWILYAIKVLKHMHSLLWLESSILYCAQYLTVQCSCHLEMQALPKANTSWLPFVLWWQFIAL